MPALALLLPSWLDLAGWFEIVVASLIMIGLGRTAIKGHAPPESELLAGWGICALVFTGWGIATPISLRLPGILLATVGIAAHFPSGGRRSPAEWRTLGRVAVLALPLLAIMASARPSLPDTWLNLLPNAAYLFDHDFFPADARPPAYSFIAGSRAISSAATMSASARP